MKLYVKSFIKGRRSKVAYFKGKLDESWLRWIATTFTVHGRKYPLEEAILLKNLKNLKFTENGEKSAHYVEVGYFNNGEKRYFRKTTQRPMKTFLSVIDHYWKSEGFTS